MAEPHDHEPTRDTGLEREDTLAAIQALDERGDQLAQEFVDAYERARAELAERLAHGDDTPLTRAHIRAILHQVEQRLDVLYGNLSARVGQVFSDTARHEADQALREVRQLAESLPGGVVHMSPLLSPVVPHQAVEAIIESAGQHIKAVNEDIRSTIRRDLAQAMIRGETTQQAAKRVFASGITLEGLEPRATTKSGKEIPVFKSVEDRAEAIARTELNRAANTSHLATYRELKKQLPNLKVRWSSVLCATTCQECASLNGQLRDPDETFSNGLAAPPAHPRCLCRLVAELVDLPTTDATPQGGDMLKPTNEPHALELMTDAFEPEIEVLQDAVEGKPLRVRLLLTRANVRNKNRRVYPRQVLEDAVARGREKLQGQHITMEWEHPPAKRDGSNKVIGFNTDPRRAVSVIDDVYMRGNAVYVDTTFLDTDMGRAIQAQVKAGKKPPVSLRSLGKTERGIFGGQPTDIATFLDWHGGDWVDKPALPEAGPEEILTDAQIDDALTSAREEFHKMDKLEELKAQLQALTDAKSDDKAAIEKLEQKIEQLEMQRDKLKEKAEGGEKDTEEMKDSIAKLSQQVQSLTDALASQKNAEAKAAAKAEVKALADSVAANADYQKRFTPDMVKDITDRVAAAESKEQAEKVLNDSVATYDRAIAAAQLAARGFTPGGGGAGRTVADIPGRDVKGPDTLKAVMDKFDQAFNDHRRLTNAPTVDDSVRAANKKTIATIIDSFQAKEGKALTDSAQAILDGEQVFTDSTTADLFNQPTIAAILLTQQFQEMEALQMVQGLGPNSFESQAFGSQIGTVLRVPVEYRVLPTIGGVPAQNLPYYSNSMKVGEGVAIPELSLKLAYLAFAPDWRKVAFRVTDEVIAALKNGPINYDVWARHMFHVALYKAQTIDLAIYENMLQTSSEYGAAKVNAEVVAGTEWTYAGGGSAGGYGANVVGVAQLLCGGVAGTPNLKIPVVRPRVTTDLAANGQVTTTTVNPITIPAINGVAQVMGYLDENNQIAQIPGSTAPTFAVDWFTGKVVFNAASGVDAATHLPTVTYTFEKNFDTFQVNGVTLPTGVTEEEYLNGLLRQLDNTAALMGSSPRFSAPNLGIMSLTAANFIQNAQTFYKWVSPEGAMLKDPRIVSNTKFAERNGIEYAKINTPWSAGDARILLTRQGATKYGIDKPFQVEGPYPGYDTATGQVNGQKIAYGAENSVIATPQVTDQAGNVLNPLLRSVILR